MGGEPGRNIALDLFDGVIGIGAGEREEDVGDPAERPAGPLQRLDGVGEIRLVRVGDDGCDLGVMRRQRRLEGRRKLPGLDPLERRRLERTIRPVRQQRVSGRRRELGGFVHGEFLAEPILGLAGPG